MFVTRPLSYRGYAIVRTQWHHRYGAEPVAYQIHSPRGTRLIGIAIKSEEAARAHIDRLHSVVVRRLS
jgi:hypothetical protein